METAALSDILQSLDAHRKLCRRLRLGKTTLEVLLMLHLSDDGERQMSSISKQLGLRPPAATTAAAELEKRGFARRFTCPKNRTHILLQITAAGRSALTDLPSYL
jgi:DNA-binding MarR family transcriptional regulator